MSTTTNLGAQFIGFDFRHPLQAKEFNKLWYGVFDPGIYSGGTLTKNATLNTVDITPFTCVLLSDTDKVNYGSTSQTINFQPSGGWPVSGTYSIYLLFDWADTVDNYISFNITAGAIPSRGLKIGEVVLVASAVDSVSTTGRILGTNKSQYFGEINSLTTTVNTDFVSALNELETAKAELSGSTFTGVVNINADFSAGSGFFQVDDTLQAAGFNKTPISGVDLVVSDVFRVASTSGTYYNEIRAINNIGYFSYTAAALTGAELRINALPDNNTPSSSYNSGIHFWRNTQTNGSKAIYFHRGNASADNVQSRIGVDGLHSYFTNTNIHIGGSSAPSGNVLEVTGNAQFNGDVTFGTTHFQYDNSLGTIGINATPESGFDIKVQDGGASKLGKDIRLINSSNRYDQIVTTSSVITEWNSYYANGGTLRIDVHPLDGLSNSNIEFWRGVNTTGDKNHRYYTGDGTASLNHLIQSGSTPLVTLNRQGTASGGLIVGGAAKTGSEIFKVTGGLALFEGDVTINNATALNSPVSLQQLTHYSAGVWFTGNSAADNQWTSVTYGNGLFVAVSSSGTGNRVMTSPDGITWTSRTSAADNQWRGVTYGNGLFVAVSDTGTGNRVMTSPDGITWTSRTSAVDNQWLSVTYGNGLFVAVSGTGTGNRVMTSPDGITWTSRTSAADNVWRLVTYGNGLFVAVSASGTGNRVMTSPDGITWTSRTSAADNGWNEVTYGNGLFVAVSNTGAGDRAMHTSKLL